MNYKKAYILLFNKITDITEELKELQIKCEEIIISDEEDEENENKDKSYHSISKDLE